MINLLSIFTYVLSPNKLQLEHKTLTINLFTYRLYPILRTVEGRFYSLTGSYAPAEILASAVSGRGKVVLSEAKAHQRRAEERKPPLIPHSQGFAQALRAFAHPSRLRRALPSAKKSLCSSKLGTDFFRHLAESEGFEPPEPCSSTVFKTAAIDHSANSPDM